MEFLDIEIYNHFSKPHTYIIWSNKNLIGEVVEDDIMKLLDREQVVGFYHMSKDKFKVPTENVEKFVVKPKSND